MWARVRIPFLSLFARRGRTGGIVCAGYSEVSSVRNDSVRLSRGWRGSGEVPATGRWTQMSGSDALYWQGAKILEQVRAGRGKVKGLCFAAEFRNKKQLVDLVEGASQNYGLLNEVLEKTLLLGLEKRELKGRTAVAIVLLFDHLIRGKLQNNGPLAEAIIRHKARLHAEYVLAKIRFAKAGIKAVESDSHASDFPRFVRVNTLKISPDEAVKQLALKGFHLVDDISESAGADAKAFCRDGHVEALFSFAAGTNFHRHPLYLDGSLILQDKASCLPAFLLSLPPGSEVIDSCAAPGNKTSHLAAMLGETGRVYAFERDQKRFEILRKMLGRAGVSNVVAACQDFLAASPGDPTYSKVEYALVDPSCSGSGMLALNEQQEVSAERLRSLSNFQCMIIRHAMRFPKLKKLVYSTCSIHEAENEQVVGQILELETGWRLVKRPLPAWKRRGLEKYAFWQDVLRADPKLDKTHGFFVALFERR